MTISPITEVSYPFALAKKHPWMLFCRSGEYVAHRKRVAFKNQDVPSLTIAFDPAMDNVIPQDTRTFFQEVIADMKALSLAPTQRLTKADK